MTFMKIQNEKKKKQQNEQMQKLLFNSLMRVSIKIWIKANRITKNEFTNGCKKCESIMKRFCKMGTRDSAQTTTKLSGPNLIKGCYISLKA